MDNKIVEIGILIVGNNFKLSCGNSVGLLHSVPCPCGNPSHWLLKIEELKEAPPNNNGL